MSTDTKVLIATLWQQTSGEGNEYLSGFLGKARVVGFKGEPTADGTPTWDLYVQPGKEQEERGGSGQRESRSPTSSSRTGVQARRSAKGRRSKDQHEMLEGLSYGSA